MSPVTPLNLARLTPIAKLRLSLEVLVAYARVRWVMRRGGRDTAEGVATLRSYARRHRIDGGPITELTAGWRLANATVKTLTPVPADSRCLFRSLTLLTLMERRGLSPTLVIGVRSMPFLAHAWIELHGEPLLWTGDEEYARLKEL